MSSGDPETRKRILDSALRLIEESGSQEVRIGDIARAAGISRQAVYLHFADRTDLLVATARHADEVNDLEGEIEKCRSAVGGLASLDALVDFWGNYIPRIYRLARALLSARETDEAAAAAWADRMAQLRDGCRGTIRCLEVDGLLAPGWSPDLAADVLWAMLSIGTWEALVYDLDWPVGRYVEHMQRALRRMLVRDQDG